MKVLVNEKTQATLNVLTATLPHALLLAGKPGVGLATIARFLAKDNLATFIQPLDAKGQVNNSGTIGIENIRDLYDQTRSKQTTSKIFIIDNAERMSLGAQAAFLKLLEEPTQSTYFILTSHFPKQLLPTVRSRLQIITIEPITSEQTAEYLDALPKIDPKKRLQLEFLAAGLPAELSRLVTDAAYFNERATIMADARTFLSGTQYQKLLIVHKFYQDRSVALQLLDSALLITRLSISQRPSLELSRQLDTLLTTREKISANHNSRLQLMHFVLQ